MYKTAKQHMELQSFPATLLASMPSAKASCARRVFMAEWSEPINGQLCSCTADVGNVLRNQVLSILTRVGVPEVTYETTAGHGTTTKVTPTT